MINQSKRPVLYFGGGVISSGSTETAIAFAEKATLPTTMTLMALGTIPMRHPLYLGMLGMHAARSTNMVMEEADLLIVIGARFDDRAIGRAEKFCPNAKIIHVDIDKAEISKIKRPDIAINADAGQILELLLPLVEKNQREEWMTRVNQLKQDYPCLLYTSPSPRDLSTSRMPSSA